MVAILPDRGKLAAWLALATTLVTFGLTLHLPAHFIAGQPGFQFEINRKWIELGAAGQGIFYHVGVDGLSLWLVVLSGLLGPVGVLASWNAIKERKKVFYSLFLVQQTAMIGVFLSLDLMLYYGFWELTLVPMAVLIAMYGRKDGPKAATKFFLFTFIPSAPLLVGNPVALREDGNIRFHAASEPDLQRARCRLQRCSGWRSPSWWRSRSRCRCFRCMDGWRTASARRRWRWRW